MKTARILFILSALVLSACTSKPINPSNSSEQGSSGQTSNSEPTSETGSSGNTSTSSEGGDVEHLHSMQDAPILHCWNWSMNNIRTNLQSIKDAGYKAVQISPMQPQKSYYNDDLSHGWWKLYQPLGFSVAQSGQNILGTKGDLKNLCDAAEEKGIKVIVDVVANHLAGNSSTSLFGDVQNYESQIYSNNLIHTLNKSADDNNLQSIVQGTIGDFPDLKTENNVVQQRVLSLLKEYIDVGVDGFRFDAAKHIETPDDGAYASNFWDVVINGATSYARTKNYSEDPYYYGEILYTCGVGRSFSSYTKYMSTIDSNQGSDVLAAVSNSNTSKLKQTYNSGVNPNKLVLWAESHDTFGNTWGESKDTPQSTINKAYVIQTSRKSASSLFLARPNSMSSMMGEACSHAYEDAEIKAINKFHNTFRGKSENINISNGCFVNVRGAGGAAIVNVANSNSLNVQVDVALPNGSYTDTVTNKKYTVSNGKATVSFTNGVVVLVGDNQQTGDVPSISLGSYNEVYSGSQNITVNISDAITTTYKINELSETTFTGNTITLPSSLMNGVITLTIKASNNYGVTTKTSKLYKTTALVNKSLIIYNVDTQYSYYVWAWGGGTTDKFYAATGEDTALGFDLGNCTGYTLVQFAKETANPSWDKKQKQTDDCSTSDRVVDFTTLTWKNS